MFNISFGELFAFGIIALIILGPEKLPQTLRTVLFKYRAIKNHLNKIQNDLENELEVIELKRIMQEELQKIKQNEEQLKQQLAQMQQDIESVQNTKAVADKIKPQQTQYYVYQSANDGLKAPFLIHPTSSRILSEDQAA
ncbi:MAG TPA: twin-arginine translocase subunit TatB [Acinetobacter ursingii]|uniref:Sec-independent protein translocase protein TatB n=2 Tax=Acinetobacter ursingii TaxID=108980 RepID=UPI000665CC96|nr:Sec-independent protein translocase protein TatB [Acinetobacter ursingii]MCH2005813.1 Sec-independent protein translocase protein TatB [Acinetobacter ursingii]MCU4305397.1 Sec-independent protein translocase protein TatB [Acinetobacter ursingii]MCU4371403.1 Sec-independent protein translocase protein TatB [Acinetobacter ursingii]MCU4381085.1 Sec-independent protein translocase protein TatB [Acinetobacter ursingii]MCU4608823.1 Sec-independent protein translocase protein TatB [Acinetobacter u